MLKQPPESAPAKEAKVDFRGALNACKGDWPDLPVAIKNGIGVRVGDIAYVGLGSAGTELFALDLNNPGTGWKRKAEFIGPPTGSAAATSVDGKIFVFSGNGKATTTAKSPIIFDRAYTYDPAVDRWSALDTSTPVGLSGAKALPLTDGRIAFIGGYNKQLFDKYLADLSGMDADEHPAELGNLINNYMGMRPEDYKWNNRVLFYDPKTNAWGTFGDAPYLPNCDSAAVQTNQDEFIVVSGEIKPGLRTPEVKRLAFIENAPTWQSLTDLPVTACDNAQEGVAGAFVGYSGDRILVAGGVNFPGARNNAAAGKWYAHQGLTKKWRDEIYAFDGQAWREAGKLPHGLGYGIAFSVPDGLLIVGGEDAQGKARTEVFVIN